MIGAGWPYTTRVVSRRKGYSVPTEHDDLNPYGRGLCPECGVDLKTVSPEKHSVAHYGPDPIPYTPQTAKDTLLARQRQAVLLGAELPER